MFQITIKSFKLNILKMYIKFLKSILEKREIDYKFVSIPTKRKRITLLKSPHVHKKAREQFQLKLYKKIIIIEKFKYLNCLAAVFINKTKFINISIQFLGE